MRKFLLLIVFLFFIASCKEREKPTTQTARCEPAISFLAVGDIMLDRGVSRTIKRNGKFYPFEKTAFFIRKYDMAFCNLESVISNIGRPIRKPITFEADTEMIYPLIKAGFNIINLANNHALDYGRKALADCISRLKNKKVYVTGAGNTLHQAYRPVIAEKNGIKLAILAYCTIPTGMPVKRQSPQIAVFNKDTALYYLKILRDSVDYIIVSMHWGTEYTHRPDQTQREIAHFLIDNGARIIIGHHPHVIQEIEYYKDGLILYSLGNFIFDQRGRERNEGIIFTCKLTKDHLENIEFFPYRIKKMRPEFLPHQEKVEFVRRYRKLLLLN